MSVIADIVGDLVGHAVLSLFSRMFHAVGRWTIFLLTLGYGRIPPLGEDESTLDSWASVGLVILGLVVLIALLVLFVILLILLL